MSSRLYTHYKEKIVPALQKELGKDNMYAVPRMEKVVVMVGVGNASKEKDGIARVAETLATITGQAAVKTLAKKSIAGFKIREGQVVGLKVTLRGDRMYDFIDKLVNIAFPRVKDFRGISPKSFNGHGNYTIGIKEHLVFPEVSSDDVDQTFGLEISIATTTKNDKEAHALLKALGFPFNEEKVSKKA